MKSPKHDLCIDTKDNFLLRQLNAFNPTNISFLFFLSYLMQIATKAK